MFAGNAASLNRKYGQGWRIADGTDGTPNLTDAFPKFGTFAQKLGAGGSKDITATVANHTLSIGQIPAHKHDLSVFQGENPDSGSYIRANDQGPGRIANQNTRGSTGGSLPHSHGLNGATGANEPQFTYLVPLYFTGVAGTYS
jgi:microcystin-dependent protein